MVSIVPDKAFGFDKFQLMGAFDERKIDTRPFFSQLSSLQALDDYPEAKRFVRPDNNGAHAAACGINLPSGYNMDEAKVDVVCGALKEILGFAP